MRNWNTAISVLLSMYYRLRRFENLKRNGFKTYWLWNIIIRTPSFTSTESSLASHVNVEWPMFFHTKRTYKSSQSIFLNGRKISWFNYKSQHSTYWNHWILHLTKTCGSRNTKMNLILNLSIYCEINPTNSRPKLDYQT